MSKSVENNIPILPAVGGAVSKVLESLNLGELFKGKEAKRQAFELAIAKELQSINLAQIEINKIEAERRKFTWREALGFAFVGSIIYNWILHPFLLLIINIFNPEFEFPLLDLSQMIPILSAMLGVYGIQAYQSFKTK